MSASPVILVTGASSGIGEATARLFGRQGYCVAIGARRSDRLESLAQVIEASGGQALAVTTDLTRLEDIQDLVQATLDRFGQIDVLFNNAGAGRLDWLENLDPVQGIENQVHLNLVAVIQVCREVLPYMIARRSGHIVNMASVAGLVATPTYSVYAASKFGVRGFSEALRREAGIYGIRVSVIYPGGVATEFSEHAGIRRKSGYMTPPSLRLEADRVAREVYSLVRRPRRGALIPWPMYLAVWFNLFFPGLADRIIENRFTRRERGR